MLDFESALIQEGVAADTAAKFIRWHKEHPSVWKIFEELAIETWNAGIPRWSAKGIGEVVRWKSFVEKRGKFKLNNNYLAYYARAFQLKHPYAASLFETREVAGLKDSRDDL